MKYLMMFITACLLISGCKKGSDDDNGTTPAPGSNAIEITGTPDALIYWGDEVSITGTGFSANKADYDISFAEFNIQHQDPNKPEIISASATSIKVRIPKIPDTTLQGKVYYKGPSWNDVLIINIKGKKDTTEALKIAGWPRIYNVCGADNGNTTSLFPAQNTWMELTGASNALAPSDVERNVKLSARVNGEDIPVPFEWDDAGSCNDKGVRFNLDPNKFADLSKCEGDIDWGGGYREIELTASIPGTSVKATNKFKVAWKPEQFVDQVAGINVVSKTPDPNHPTFAEWKITGKNMYYKTAKFVNTTNPLWFTTIAIVTTGPPVFYNEATITIPVSQLSANYAYKVFLVDQCDKLKQIGQITVLP